MITSLGFSLIPFRARLFAGLGVLSFLLVSTSNSPAQGSYTAPYTVTTLAGRATGEDGMGNLANFGSPYGTAVDVNGNVYVADTGDQRIRKITPAGVVTTVAGSGSGGSADGIGTSATFSSPRGIVIDSAGNLFVVDSDNCKIRKITPTGVVSTFAGSGSYGSLDATGTAATFSSPQGIAIDASDTLYIADTESGKIRKITSGAVVTTLAGDGTQDTSDGPNASARFVSPVGVAVDASGNVYVVDSGNNVIRMIGPTDVTTIAGSVAYGSADGNSSNATFSAPSGIAIDTNGNLYIADTGSNKIRKITPSLDVTTVAGSGTSGSTNGSGTAATFAQPGGLCVDANGGLFVADTNSNKIRAITASGVVTTLAGSGSTGPGSADGTGGAATFNQPKGVAVDSSGNIYVVDTANQKIRKVTPAGVVTTFAGSGGIGSTNANGTAASFKYLFSATFDSAGVLYVADTNNHKIRKITPAGDVTTIAGTGSIGSTNANGTSASFNYPFGITVDANGVLYVADTNNHKIRRIATNGDVTTFAGSGTAGGTNGNGTAASFTNPCGIVIDASGTLYIGDTFGFKVRKIAPNGDVTTLAGSGVAGYADGTGTAAQFRTPEGLALDAAGNVYIADTDNNMIRRITPAGVVSTIAGSTAAGNSDGTGAAARFYQPSAVGIDSSGTLYIVDALNHKIRKAVSASPHITSSLTANGTYGSAFTYTLIATNTPTTFTATGLPTGLSIDAGTGAISGAPTQAGTFTVTLGATNANGSDSAALTLTVAKASATVVLGGLSRAYNGSPQSATATTTPTSLTVTFTYDGSATAPTAIGSYAVIGTVLDANYAGSASGTLSIGIASQSVTFSAPADRLTNAVPFSVSATATSGLPVTFAIVSGPATVSAGTVTLTGSAGIVTLRATQAGNGTYAAATPVDRSFTVTSAAPATSAPVITLQPVNQSVKAGATARFSVGATGNPTPNFQWRRGGLALAGQVGATLSLGSLTLADSGTSFDVVVSNTEGSVTSAAATLTVAPVITSNQVYLGSLGTGGSYALATDSAGTAVLIGYLPRDRGSFIVHFTIAPDGTFLATTTVTSGSASAAINATSGQHASPTATAIAGVAFSGKITNGQLAGQVDGTGEAFSGTVQSMGSTSALMGYFEAPLVNGGSGNIYLIVAADGTAMGARTDASGTTAALGVVAASGQFSVAIDATTLLQGSLTSALALTGQTVTNGTLSGSFSGVATAVSHTDRLVNISTRGMAGDGDKIIIAGFVISGVSAKDVLIRAVGPSLAPLGVDSPMENPALTLYRGSGAIQTNDDWSSAANAPALSAVAARLGAFALSAGSKDAAILATLAPGSYTAQITRSAGSASGVALIEVYDASANPGGETQKLINISSRGEVSTGSGILIGGFVVTGNYPKKVLVRGVGPTLVRFGLGNPLANPVLRLYQGTTVIAANDDWITDNAVAIDAAAAQVGAFALDNGSKDAALLVTLAPGVYTAQLSGNNSGTGVALLEIYEVP